MHYFISDTHFTHTGAALHHSARPFATIDEHDRALIEAWNSVVTPGDTVWHLGDFGSDRPDPKAMRRIFSQLRGSKHLILGNHDQAASVRELGWSSVRDYAEIAIDKQRLVLSHYPMRVWNGMRRGGVQLYGHCHARLPGNRQSIDIGVDVMGWAPVTWPQIKAKLDLLPELHFEPDMDFVEGLEAAPEGSVEDDWAPTHDDGYGR